MSKPRLLDLFCGAGGAAMGYSRAGFEVVGVDIKPQPHYPFEFHQADALTFPLVGFDVIHASPPCQAYSAGTRMRNGYSKDHPRLIEPVRERLLVQSAPWVIENVPGSPLRACLLLCGSMFGLSVRRHRYFESSHLLLGPLCEHGATDVVIAVYGDHPENCPVREGHPARRASTLAHAHEAMGMDWADWFGTKEAIPPAYAEWIGAQLMAHLERAA